MRYADSQLGASQVVTFKSRTHNIIPGILVADYLRKIKYKYN